MNIAKNIKKFRNISNISQQKLANRTGLTRNYLSLVESGKREPSISTLNKISRELNIPTSLLVLNLEDNPENPLDKLLFRAYELASKHNQQY